MGAKRIDLVGQIFGRLKVVEYVGHDKWGASCWKCLCECGKETVVRSYHLRSGRVCSCGCFMRELASKRIRTCPTKGNLKHGGKHSRLYRIWGNMKTRCFNANNRAYKWYGAIGITICNDWMKFENFQKWAIKSGYQDDLTIERIDPYGNYEPSNCKWIPLNEQRRNQRRSKQWQKSN